jgi:phosphate transport system substrate-binding protein
VTSSRTIRSGGAVLATAVFLAACGGGSPTAAPTQAPGTTAAPTRAALTGKITIDGSSTVYPVTQAVAEEFNKANPGVQLTVGFAGTGGGFKKFCNNETDINDASRPIKTADTAEAKSEGTLCKEAGVEWLELGVATDALSVVVANSNTFIDCITTAQLKTIWDQGSTVTKWSDVDPSWPAEPLALFGPGADSGTFDYFTEVINGKAKQSRSDYTPSEDDNALVTGVAGNQYALGYFGYSYLEENLDKIHALKIDSGSGCIAPSAETVNGGTYQPLARPLFIYPSRSALERPEFAAFVQFYLDNVNTYVDELAFIEAIPDVLAKAKADLAAALK